MKIKRYYTRETLGVTVESDRNQDPDMVQNKVMIDFYPIRVATEEDAYSKCLEYLTSLSKRSLFSPDSHQIKRIANGYQAIRGKKSTKSDITIIDIVIFEKC